MNTIICYGCGLELPSFKRECPECGAKVGLALLAKNPAPQNPKVCAFFDNGTCRWNEWRRQAGASMLEQAQTQHNMRVQGGSERLARIQKALNLHPSLCSLQGISGGWHYCAASAPVPNSTDHTPNAVKQWGCSMYEPMDLAREPNLQLRLYAVFADAPSVTTQPQPIVEGSVEKPLLTILSANSLADIGGREYEKVEQQLTLFRELFAESDWLMTRVETRYRVAMPMGARKSEVLYDFIAHAKLIVVWVTPELLNEPDCMDLVDRVEDLMKHGKAVAVAVLASETDRHSINSSPLFDLFRYQWLPRTYMALDSHPDRKAAYKSVIDELLAFFSAE